MSDTEEENVSTDINNTTAPMLLSDKVKSDNCIWYMLRLTPDKKEDYTREEILDMIEDFTQDDVWFMAEELSKKGVLHYHLVMLCLKDPRETIKEWLVTKYPNKWKKQDGNKRYNLQEPEDLERVFIYSSKDSDYTWGKGINSDFITYVNGKSYQKKDSRLGLLQVAKQRYLNDEITDRELFREVCDILISISATGSLNPTTAKNFVLGCKCIKDPRYKDQLYDLLNI